MIDPDKLLRRISYWSTERTRLHGEYYTTFGIFGTLYYIIPYFIWSHDSDIEYQTLTLRVLGCILCFCLVILHQSKVWVAHKLVDKYNLNNKHKKILTGSERKKFISKATHSGFLPLYWHMTLCFCLPLMSTYNLLDSSFDTSWVVSSSLSILTLVLLVDWISFIILMFVGIFAGYFLFVVWTGNLHIHYESINYFLVVYVHFFSMTIGGFFLFQKEMMVNEIKNTNNELKKLNSNLDGVVKRRTEVLDKALKSRTEFLNNISHEIRTPLQGILGLSSTLAEHWKKFKDPEREEQVKVIAESGDRLMSLVSNLLDISKFEAGKMLFDFAPHNLINTIKIAIAELKPFYYEKHIQIIFKPTKNTEGFNISYDQHRITQVIRNFLSNAIKYSNDKDVVLTIGYADEYGNSCEESEAYAAIIKVKDNGIGVPENELQEIFFPFAQSSRTNKKAGGTGLGLALCAEIIHAHQGKIWAYNNIGENGSTFCFTIPLIEPTGLAISKVNKEIKPIVTPYNPIQKTSYKVLFVDDEKFCLLSGKVILECSGFEVKTADCGADALMLIEKDMYDLILLDLMMPDMYGTDVLLKIKANKNYANIPVILQSGASDQSEISKAISLGAAGYIVKPYNKEEMLTQIQAVLGIKLIDNMIDKK